MRILVTGASGFVGRAAIEALARRDMEIHAVCRHRPKVRSPHIWHEVDLLDKNTSIKIVDKIDPEIVLHLAWSVEQGAVWPSPQNLDWIGASLTLFRAAADAGVKYFIGCGTCYEYDWPKDGLCNEFHTPLKPAKLYGVAKDATRRAIEAYATEINIRFAWARLFYLYGPGEGCRRLVPSLARALTLGEIAKCSSGRPVVDFMDVRDAGEALAALTVSRLVGCFNIASGEGTSIADIARKLADFAGRPDLLRIGSLPDRPDEPPRIVADVTRLHTEIGYRPTRSLDEGLRDALRYWAKAQNESEL